MRQKISNLLIGLGVCAVCAAALLYAYNRYESRRAGEASAAVEQVLRTEIESGSADTQARRPEAVVASSMSVPEPTEMKAVEIDGKWYIGYLSIPKLELDLPVMSEWSYPNLRVAICRYSGSVGMGNLVIAGHSYPEHFGRLQTLTQGDTVLFTDMDNVTTTYQVQTLETLEPTAIEEMTKSDADLTLFTCNYSGQARITVRCVRE